MKNWFWPIFSRIIECDKTQGTIYKGPQSIPTNTVEVTRSFLEHLRGCWKHKFFEKQRQAFPWKFFSPNFSPLIDCDKLQETRYKFSKNILTITVEDKKAILWDLKLCWKQNFWTVKATFPVNRKIWPFFSHYRMKLTSGDISEGYKRFYDNYCWSYKTISLGPKRLLKMQIFEKKGKHSTEKKTWPFFFSHYRV